MKKPDTFKLRFSTTHRRWLAVRSGETNTPLYTEIAARRIASRRNATLIKSPVSKN